MIVYVTGVSGAGKTTVSRLLAEQLGWPALDADDLHSTESRRRMSAGVPLSDDDRWPWLDRVRETALTHDRTGIVVACSALRRVYRDRLAHVNGRTMFVWLDPPETELRRRVAARTGHFMPAGLLQSQLDLLEPLEPDETGLRIAGKRSAQEAADQAVAEVLALAR